MAKPLDLEARIAEVRAECESYIDAKAAEMKKECAGVPIGVLRQLLTAKSGACVCNAYLMARAEESAAAAVKAAQ